MVPPGNKPLLESILKVLCDVIRPQIVEIWTHKKAHSLPWQRACHIGRIWMICIVLYWASYQIRKIVVAHAPGMPRMFSAPPRLSDPDMHHGTCVTLISGFLWSMWRGKRSRHSGRMRNAQFYVSGKRSMEVHCKFAIEYPGQPSDPLLTTRTAVKCW